MGTQVFLGVGRRSAEKGLENEVSEEQALNPPYICGH